MKMCKSVRNFGIRIKEITSPIRRQFPFVWDGGLKN